MHLLDRGDVHRGREGVVGRLAAVDVVVRVHRRLAAERRAEQLVGPIRDHLVRVHVGLGAGAGLPHHQREMLVQPAVRDLLGSARDRVGEVRLQAAVLAIDQRRRELDDAERAHQRQRHGLGADPEVLQAALGLRAPIAIRRHLDRAKGVGLDAHGKIAGHRPKPALQLARAQSRRAGPGQCQSRRRRWRERYFLRKRSSATTSALPRPPSWPGSFGPAAAALGSFGRPAGAVALTAADAAERP